MAETPRRRHLAALAVITAVGAALRFATLDVQSFWNDEVFTAALVSRPFGGMLDGIEELESTPPLYFAAAWLWAKIFGEGEIGLRSLSALAGTLLIPVAYLTAAALVSRRAAVITAALAATSPILVWYSQEARSYSLMVLLSGAALLFFARSLRDPSWINLGGWAVLSAAAIATHYFAALPAATEAVILLARIGLVRQLVAAIAVVVASGLAVLPVWYEQVRQTSHESIWIEDIALDLRFEETVRQLATPAPASPWAGAGGSALSSHDLWWLGAIVLAVAIFAVVRLTIGQERDGALLALAVGSATLLLSLFGAIAEPLVGRGDYLIERNVLTAWLPLAIVVSAGIGARRAGILGIGAIAALCTASIVVVSLVVADASYRRDDWRRVARQLRNDSVVVVAPAYQANPLRFYDRSLREVAPGGVRVSEISVVQQAGGQFGEARLSSIFDSVGTERVGRWEIRRWRSPSPTVIPAQPGMLVRSGDEVGRPTG